MTSRRHLPSAPLLACLALSLVAGCDGCNPSVESTDDGGASTGQGDGGSVVSDAGAGPADAATAPDAWTPDATAPAPDAATPPDAGTPDAARPDAAPPEARVLSFEGTSPTVIFHGATADVVFELARPNGAPLAGLPVMASTTGVGATLNVAQATTNASGLATFRLTAGTADADLSLTATAERANDVTVQVQVRVNPVGTLSVTVTSTTRIPLTGAEAAFWVSASPPDCAALASTTPPPTASFTHAFTPVPGMATFPGLATGHKVTVLARGHNDLAEVGSACADNLTIVGGGTTPVALTITQGPTGYVEDYDVLLHVALGNALPEPYESALDTVTAILSDPAGWVVYQALVQADEYFVFTTFTYWDVPDGSGGTETVQASYEDVSSHPEIFNVWRTGRGLVDTILANQLGTTYTTVTTVSGDIRTTVSDFEVGARYALVESAATRPPHEITESWNDMVFTWRYGCAAGDVGCARRVVALDDPELAPAATSYRATITHEPLVGPPPETERFQVVPEPHAFMLRYGAVILIALNEVVFPNLPAAVAGNNLTEVVTNLVDCASLGADLAVAAGVGSASTWEGFCVAGIGLGVGAAEDQLLGLTAGGNPSLVGRDSSGVASGGVFYLLDQDHDMATELVRDLTMYVAWYDPNTGTSSEVSSPITGRGRLAASDCTVDRDCAASRSCQAIPSYLEVRAVEKDCRRPVGTAPGMASCTSHAQCATGFCVDMVTSGGTVTPGFCYLACETTCSAPASCEATGAAYDLDGVRSGLGEATTACCVAP